MIASIPTLTLKRVCYPSGTRGGIVWRKWIRFQSTATTQKKTTKQSQFQSQFHSLTLSEDLDLVEYFDQEIELPAHVADSKYSLDIARKVPDIVQNLIQSIAHGSNFSQIFRHFNESDRQGQLGHLTTTDFSNVLLSAKPKSMLSSSSIVRAISDGKVAIDNPLSTAYEKFWTKVNMVLGRMISYGHHLTVMEFTHLLGCAKFTMNRPLFHSLWHRMVNTGIRPNTLMYNIRIAMHAGVIATKGRQRMPVKHGESYLQQWQTSETNSLTMCMGIYQEMLKLGLFPDVTTIELLLYSHARQGDVDGISKILQNVYGISVDGKIGEGSIPSANILAGSPIFPNSKTLTVIAISYLRNGRFEHALQAIDLISRVYQVKIEEQTWNTLLGWSYAFSTPKYKILSPNTTLELWNQMSNTYKIVPTLQTRDILIRTFLGKGQLPTAEKSIREAAVYYRRQIQHKYLLERDRWVNASVDENDICEREKVMNDALFEVCKWKDALGYWLFALVREHYRSNREPHEQQAFQDTQQRLLGEFGIYWQSFRPTFTRHAKGVSRPSHRRAFGKFPLSATTTRVA